MKYFLLHIQIVKIMSPFARRVWIEMLEKLRDDDYEDVTLREKGVD